MCPCRGCVSEILLSSEELFYQLQLAVLGWACQYQFTPSSGHRARPFRYVGRGARAPEMTRLAGTAAMHSGLREWDAGWDEAQSDARNLIRYCATRWHK